MWIEQWSDARHFLVKKVIQTAMLGGSIKISFLLFVMHVYDIALYVGYWRLL